MISRQKTRREKPEDQGADKIDRHEYEPGEERRRQKARPFRRDVSGDFPLDTRSFADGGFPAAPVVNVSLDVGSGSDAQCPYGRVHVAADPIR